MECKKIVIAGGTGFLGKVLIEWFSKRFDEIVVLSRSSIDLAGVKIVCWDRERLGEWKEELENAEVLINLAGVSVNCRYHKKNSNGFGKWSQ
ncbi:MAG: NAD-dependent epimerase/dehydratase family protein [Verrucomicrobiota bacterium]